MFYRRPQVCYSASWWRYLSAASFLLAISMSSPLYAQIMTPNYEIIEQSLQAALIYCARLEIELQSSETLRSDMQRSIEKLRSELAYLRNTLNEWQNRSADYGIQIGELLTLLETSERKLKALLQNYENVILARDRERREANLRMAGLKVQRNVAIFAVLVALIVALVT